MAILQTLRKFRLRNETLEGKNAADNDDRKRTRSAAPSSEQQYVVINPTTNYPAGKDFKLGSSQSMEFSVDFNFLAQKSKDEESHGRSILDELSPFNNEITSQDQVVSVTKIVDSQIRDVEPMSPLSHARSALKSTLSAPTSPRTQFSMSSPNTVNQREGNDSRFYMRKLCLANQIVRTLPEPDRAVAQHADLDTILNVYSPRTRHQSMHSRFSGSRTIITKQNPEITPVKQAAAPLTRRSSAPAAIDVCSNIRPLTTIEQQVDKYINGTVLGPDMLLEEDLSPMHKVLSLDHMKKVASKYDTSPKRRVSADSVVAPKDSFINGSALTPTHSPRSLRITDVPSHRFVNGSVPGFSPPAVHHESDKFINGVAPDTNSVVKLSALKGVRRTQSCHMIRRKSGLRVRFSADPKIHVTFHSTVYERRSDRRNSENKSMMEIYYELMRYKLTEMWVHPQSSINTNKHLAKLGEADRAKMVKTIGDILAEQQSVF